MPENGVLSRKQQACLPYRGASLIHKRIPLEPYSRTMPGVLEGSWGGGRFLMGVVPLYYSGHYGKVPEINDWIFPHRGTSPIRKRPPPKTPLAP